jgi:hypothetical protein
MALPNDVICIIQENLENEVCPFYTRKDVYIDIDNFKKSIGLTTTYRMDITTCDMKRRSDLKKNNYDNVKMIQDLIISEKKYKVPKRLLRSVLPLSQKNIPIENIVILAKNTDTVLDSRDDIHIDTFLFAKKYGNYECKQVETLKYLNYGNVGVSARCTIKGIEWKDGFIQRAEQIMTHTPNNSGWVHLLLLEDCVQFIISGKACNNLLEYLKVDAYIRGGIYEKAQAYECYYDDYEKYDEILNTNTSISEIDNEINEILKGRFIQ